MIYCASLLINPLLMYTSNEAQDFVYGGVKVVTWFHEKLAQVTKSYLGYSHTMTQDMCG
jgi:hypothetical protein